MKKILLLSMFAAALCFGDESIQEHERKMKEMHEQTGKGEMNKERKMEREKKEKKEKNQYKYEYKNGEEKTRGDGSMMQQGNGGMNGGMMGGSRGGGGGGGRR